MNKNLFVDIVVDEVISSTDYTINYIDLANNIFFHFYDNRMSDENGLEIFSIEDLASIQHDEEIMQAIFDKTDFCKKKFNSVNNGDKKEFFTTYSSLTEYIEEHNKIQDNKIYLFKILDSKDNYQEFLNFYEKVNFKNKLLDRLPEKNIEQKKLKI